MYEYIEMCMPYIGFVVAFFLLKSARHVTNPVKAHAQFLREVRHLYKSICSFSADVHNNVDNQSNMYQFKRCDIIKNIQDLYIIFENMRVLYVEMSCWTRSRNKYKNLCNVFKLVLNDLGYLLSTVQSGNDHFRNPDGTFAFTAGGFSWSPSDLEYVLLGSTDWKHNMPKLTDIVSKYKLWEF